MGKMTKYTIEYNAKQQQLFHGDCLIEMDKIPDHSIDLILCDLPYGYTEISWDNIIPFEPLWKHYCRTIKENGAIVLFANQPFTTQLIASNLELFRYSLVWNKTKVSRYAQAKNRFLCEHEDIAIFSYGKCSNNSKIKMKFNPQGVVQIEPKKCVGSERALRPGRKPTVYVQSQTGYPKSILKFKSENNNVHPTQKPVALLEYLINSYTDEGDIVLDNCMGSGSTGVACINTNRNFIGIEKDDKYFEIAKNRIEKANILLPSIA